MQLIWFNPEDKSYHIGPEMAYKGQLSLSKYQDEFMIMHQFEDEKAHLAIKIADKLNKAYQSY